MKSLKTIAVVDYSLFTKDKQYYGSMQELMDVLVGKQLEIYALFPSDSKQKLPPIDMDVKAIIPFLTDDLFNDTLINNTLKTIKCSDSSKMFVISLNPVILNYFEKNGYEVCRINNGVNDVFSSNADEINHVKHLKKILI